jgi:16S rRNA (guanine527-N7)-methyltransferase
MAKRVAFLREVLSWPGAPRGGEVVEGRAEDLARGDLAGTFELVTARSFAPPAPTAECAARFLAIGGTLIVSEPPGAPPRWDDAGLESLGLRKGASVRVDATYQVITKVAETPTLYPRRTGIPAKRPLF